MTRFSSRFAPLMAAILAFGAAGAFTATGAQAQEHHAERGRPAALHERHPAPHWVLDSRFRHDHYYPAHGARVAVLPVGHLSLQFGADHYFFHAGVWFRPVGGEFVVVTPPIGIAVPVLPAAYTTLWLGDTPYYYANGVYYANAVGAPGYVVVAPPPNADTAIVQGAGTAAGNDLVVYPRNGQSQSQLFTDRAECSRWATSQSGFEPSHAKGDDAAQAANYRRAEVTCLDGRGYTAH